MEIERLTGARLEFTIDQTLPFLKNRPAFGRDSERAEILKLLKDPACRFVSLQGGEGIGKTSLAVEVAAKCRHLFNDGVAFINAADVTNAHSAAGVIASALNIQLVGSDPPIEQVGHYLARQNRLLIIDDFNPLAVDLSKLLAPSSASKILVTVRRPLDLAGEKTVVLSKLPLGAACNLFVETWKRVEPAYVPSLAEQTAIKKIAQLNDCYPLAMQFAAGWMHNLAPAEIVAELTRFTDLLGPEQGEEDGWVGNLRPIFEKSWKMLNFHERVALQRMSAFRGRFLADDVKKIAGVSQLTINRLLERGLLVEISGSDQIRLHSAVRIFAAERLNESADEQREVQAAHARYFLGYLQSKTDDLISGAQADAVSEIERQLPNIQLALNTAIRHQKLRLIEIWVDGMFHFYTLTGRQHEGLQVMRRATFACSMGGETGGETGRLQLKVMSRLGALSRMADETESAKAILQESLKMARNLKDGAETAFALIQLGAISPANVESAKLWRVAFELAEQLGDEWLKAESSNWLAFFSLKIGDRPQAMEWLMQAEMARRRLGDELGLASILTNLGYVQSDLGDLQAAKTHLDRALEIVTQSQNFNGWGMTLTHLSTIFLRQGQPEDAERAAGGGVAAFGRTGNRRGFAEAMGQQADCLIQQQKNLDLAETLCHDALEIFRELKMSTRPTAKRLGRIALAQGELKRAKGLFAEALTGRFSRPHMLSVFTAIGELMLAGDELGTGFELLQFVLTQPDIRPEDRQRAQTVLTTLPTNQIADFTVEGTPTKSLDDWMEFIAYFNASG